MNDSENEKNTMNMAVLGENARGLQCGLFLNDCQITLNFKSKAEKSIMTEIKRVIISGQAIGRNEMKK